MTKADLVMTRSELEKDMRFADLFPEDFAHSLPLYHAALAQDLDLAFVYRESFMPAAWSKSRRNLPLVAVVNDTVGTPAGPSTWRAAVELVAWADIGVLHRAGAPTGHYAHARELAKTHTRVLVVEAPVGTTNLWLELLHSRAGLAVEVFG